MHIYESSLEQALIDHLQQFLLELGRGFSFVARQKRFTLDGQDFFIDLVFYNYILKCFVLFPGSGFPTYTGVWATERRECRENQ